MATKSADRTTARERLLDAAEELFYGEGVRTVGIDRVIARAGVAKASLYNTFGSKDELIRAYLERRHERWRQRMTTRLAADYDTPRERLLGVFDLLAETFVAPTFNGCHFVNASAEATPGSPVVEATDSFRQDRRRLLTELAREAGAADPGRLARNLTLVSDGATVAARLDHDPVGVAADARAMAATLVEAAIPA